MDIREARATVEDALHGRDDEQAKTALHEGYMDRMWAIHGNGFPSFYLHIDELGIISQEHAEKLARRIVGPGRSLWANKV